MKAKLKIICCAIICVWFMAGCKQEVKPDIPADFALRKFMLQDSLAEVELFLPQKLDTFFEWVDASDDACDDRRKYRFASKKFSTVAESGFFKDPMYDSVYSFTAYHVNNFLCKFDTKQTRTFDLSNWYMRMKQLYRELDKTTKFVLVDSGKVNINGRQFVEESYKIDHSWTNPNYPTTTLQVFTVIDSSMFIIHYECSKPDCNGFIEEMKKSLATLKIRKINK